MTQLSNEEMALLAPFEKQLKTALESDYVRGALKANSKIMVQILKDHNIDTSPYSNLGCGKCVLKLYKKVAEIYFKNKE